MQKHTLTNEFPDYTVKIMSLKAEDENFRNMYVNYEEVNALIVHYEDGEESHTTDTHLTDLRKKRLHLKDKLYPYLNEH